MIMKIVSLGGAVCISGPLQWLERKWPLTPLTYAIWLDYHCYCSNLFPYRIGFTVLYSYQISTSSTIEIWLPEVAESSILYPRGLPESFLGLKMETTLIISPDGKFSKNCQKIPKKLSKNNNIPLTFLGFHLSIYSASSLEYFKSIHPIIYRTFSDNFPAGQILGVLVYEI